MIDVKKIELLNTSMCTLMETSRDNHDGVDYYLSDSKLKVVNFDAVKEKYIRELSLPMPTSSDALYIDDNGDFYLIEFKAGIIDTKKSYLIGRKIYDSLLILTDIIKEGISFTRQRLSFILVYDESKNPLELHPCGEVQFSPSREAIIKQINDKRAQKEQIRFSLERFETVYFKRVFTRTKDEFENEFVHHWAACRETR